MKRAEIEKRAFADETRAKGRKLVGYAALFDTETRIGGAYVETIKAGAFSASLSTSPDILALVDHDPSRVLGRTKSGTLTLSEDQRGLAFEIELPDTQEGRDVLALADRGDLGGMSFGFTALDDFRDNGRRELRSVELHEISVVAAWPAYDGTVIEARSHHHGTSYATRTIQLWEAQSWA